MPSTFYKERERERLCPNEKKNPILAKTITRVHIRNPILMGVD